MADPRVWIDGRLVPAAEATVSVFDHGFTVGDGVFESLKVVDGTAFALRRHLERLRHSAEGLGLEIGHDDDELRRAVEAVVASAPDVGRVRLTVTAGVAPPGSGRGGGPATVVVVGTPATTWPGAAAVVTVPWPRNERSAVAGLKTTSYAENVVALAHAEARGASEALFPNTAGNLCEGTGSNVFVVLDGELVTPPLSAGCLAGVTRALVLEATGAVERDVPMAALAEVSEAFLTSTTRDVQPIHRLDGRDLPAPGPRTAAAAAAFAELEARDLDP